MARRLKDLESYLSSIDTDFPNPNVALEQYPTSSHLAARVLFTCQQSFGDIEGKRVLDLGCGTGILSIAASALEPESVTSVDCDEQAILKAMDNVREFEAERVSFVLAKVPHLPFPVGGGDGQFRFDTTVMNPPFGTKNGGGADWVFLKCALGLSRVVYSLHKTSTRKFLLESAKREFDLESAQVVAELRFQLPATYKFHKKDSVDIAVDLLRFEHKL
ncbi:hypothetical protein BASA81_004102 [Batrachochytrium salamandrivorans]|nr:hypothetical protein BASA81_004102 [Batrachochytrium salamandrivorans]